MFEYCKKIINNNINKDIKTNKKEKKKQNLIPFNKTNKNNTNKRKLYG